MHGYYPSKYFNQRPFRESFQNNFWIVDVFFLYTNKEACNIK